MLQHDSAKPRAGLQARIRAAVVLVLLAVTVFGLAWGTLNVVETGPQARNLAIAIWVVGIVVLALSGVRLQSMTDDAWVVAVVRSAGDWAGASWTRMALSLLVFGATWYLAWLGLFAAIVTVQPVEAGLSAGSHCEVGWALVKAPCSDRAERLWAPTRQVMLYLDDTVSSCTRTGSAWSCDGPTGVAAASEPAPVKAGERPDLRVYFQMSKALEYERHIRDGFQQGIESRLGSRYAIVFNEGIGTTSSYWNSVERWQAIVDEIVNRAPLTQYIVTVGSDAATAMVELEAERKFAAVPGSRFAGFIFLGVSDPMRAGLAERESATGIPGRAAVQYGTGANDWAATILHALDEPRLVHKPELIYDTSQLQDAWVAAQLQSSPLHGDRLEITGPIEGNLRVADLEENHIYFAWYSLDAVVESYSSRMDRFLIVPSTYSEANVRNFGVVVSVDDVEVGDMGANYLAMSLLEGRELEELPTVGPHFHIWINCSAVERKGIPLSPKLLRKEVRFVPDAGEKVARNDCIAR
ncbi:MAG: hypothetical protein OEW35_19670 [Gammaproteobacteria bacterium]|nr:hypothetical protein [Gammaproteobacteria bacterium]MDH4257055.1 hypothetical protein [Gammaproteobacteria bacterium]MDH5309862.1 hypothetical protein [Gammaproteobacteria bacterium]